MLNYYCWLFKSIVLLGGVWKTTPEENCPLVRVRIWFRISVRIKAGEQFSSRAIFLEPSTLKPSNYHQHFQDAKIQIPCFSLIWITNFYHMIWKYWIVMDYEKTKSFSDETLSFDLIKSIHWYWLVNIGWLADINLFNSMIWLV